MFQRDNGERSKFSDYDNTYKEYMVRGQEERGVYVEKVNKIETLILQRSDRRVSDKDTENRNLDATAVELNTKRQKHDRAKGGENHMGMEEIYNQIKLDLNAHLR